MGVLIGTVFVIDMAAQPASPVPILLLTADGDASAKAAQIGADAYLTKPFELPVLLNHVVRSIRP
jgi:DNA-binding response OmpR family regulator